MKRLDVAIRSFGFNIVENIDNKATLFVDDQAIDFDIRHDKEFDVYVNSGKRKYIKVGKIISKIVRDTKFIPKLELHVDNQKLITPNYWWNTDN